MHYHIVGIAGAGMSAIAHMLLDQGHTVSGSDVVHNQITDALVQRGAAVSARHDPVLVQGADALVATSAVPDTHPELAAALAAGIPISRRTHLWETWSRSRSIVAVAGTHGKTTTTAMLALALTQTGHDAGYLVGAAFPQLSTSARWGAPDAPLVLEADEYDRAFLGLHPAIGVITHIEWDHPDTYPTRAAYLAAFARFRDQTQQAVVVSEQAYHALQQHAEQGGAAGAAGPVQMVRYGTGEECDYRAVPAAGPPGHWDVFTKQAGHHLATLSLAVPGRHNMLNALAVLAVAHLLGADVAAVAQALAHFRGAARRFEVKGEAGGVTVVDDYAHHPTEAMATLAAARERYGARRIVAYVQPHTFSRTLALINDWPLALALADVVCVGAVYPSREQAAQFQQQIDAVLHAGRGETTPAATAAIATTVEETLSRALVERVATVCRDTRFVGTLEQAVPALHDTLHHGDVLITMGAGDGFRVGEELLQLLGITGKGSGTVKET